MLRGTSEHGSVRPGNRLERGPKADFVMLRWRVSQSLDLGPAPGSGTHQPAAARFPMSAGKADGHSQLLRGRGAWVGGWAGNRRDQRGRGRLHFVARHETRLGLARGNKPADNAKCQISPHGQGEPRSRVTTPAAGPGECCARSVPPGRRLLWFVALAGPRAEPCPPLQYDHLDEDCDVSTRRR
jgi:hypothetical protein